MSENENALQKLRQATVIRDEGKNLLQARQLEEGSTQLPAKQPPINKGKQIGVVSNLFKLSVKDGLPILQYKVVIKMHWKNAKGVLREYTVTDPKSDEKVIRAYANQLARSIFDLVMQVRQFANPNKLYFDGFKLLFSIDEGFDILNEVYEVAYNTDGVDLAQFRAIDSRAESFTVQLDRMEQSVQLVLPPDLNNLSVEDVSNTQGFVQFLEVATTMHAIRTGNYVAYGNGVCYLLNPEEQGLVPLAELDFGVYMAFGVKKSVRFVGDSSESAVPALIIEPRIAAFNPIRRISEMVLSRFPAFATAPNGSTKIVLDFLKGMFFLPIHILGTVSPKRIEGVTAESASVQAFERTDADGNTAQITVQQYFWERYERELEHPNLPCIIYNERGGRVCYIPMEFAEMCDHQPVKQSQESREMKQNVLRACTRTPKQYIVEIQRQVEAMELHNSPYLNEAGITVDKDPMTTDGRVLPPPVMIYSDPNNLGKLDERTSVWQMPRGVKYTIPASVGVWAIYAAERVGQKLFDQNNLDQFAREFVRACRMKGVDIQDPVDSRVLDLPNSTTYNIPEFENVFSDAAAGKCKFILLLTTRVDMHIHQVLKKYEQHYGIITQNVTAKVAKDAAGIAGSKPLRNTMDNIVNKTNMKLGGLNYHVGDQESQTFIGDNDLHIGLASNHPAGGYGLSEQGSIDPSVVGFASNDLEAPLAFSGGYVFQVARREEKTSVIEGIVEECVARFINHRKKEPQRIFIWRSGCTEGQYENVLKYEVPLVRAVVNKLASDAKLVIAVPTKKHNVHLLPAQISGVKPLEQNLPIGTVVDKQVVGAFYDEFFLLGHPPRLGTAKIPRYTVISNSESVSSDEIKFVAYQLSFGHQIVTSSTSLPSPCYIAEEYAKRGRNIYKANSTSAHGHARQNAQGNSSGSGITFEEANRNFTYREQLLAADNSLMRNVRFNA